MLFSNFIFDFSLMWFICSIFMADISCYQPSLETNCGQCDSETSTYWYQQFRTNVFLVVLDCNFLEIISKKLGAIRSLNFLISVNKITSIAIQDPSEPMYVAISSSFFLCFVMWYLISLFLGKVVSQYLISNIFVF